MTALTLENLDEYVEPNLPPEVLLDPYNPANDKYYEQKADLERRIVHASKIMKPKQVRAAKLSFTGMSFKEIAEKVGVTPTTASRYVNNPEARRLLSLLRHYQHFLDGPNDKHRIAFLYRIAVDNEHNKPSVAIAAFSEINKMTGAYDQGGAAQSPNITVVVNHQVLERGALDG